LDRDDIIGRIIHYAAYAIPSVLIFISLFFSSGNTKPFGLYNGLPILGVFGIHRLTMILLCVVFILHYSLMGYLFPLTRFVVTMSFMLFYIYSGGLVWVANSYLCRGYGDINFLIVGIVMIYFILTKLNNNHGFLKRRKQIFPTPPIIFMGSILILMTFIAIRLIGYAGLWQTGFWDIMHLIDQGLPAGNPNQNIYWVIMKISEFGFLLPFVSRSDLKAPLRLDPRVLIW